MKRRSTLTALVLLVAVAACSPPADQKTGPVVQKIDPATATPLELGTSLPVVADLPRRVGSDPVSFMSFASDHEVLGYTAPVGSGSLESVPTKQARPVLYDLDTKKVSVLDDGSRAEPTWVSDVWGNAEAVVWVEGRDYNIAHSTFTIHSYDRRTRKVTTIGELHDPSGKVAYGDDLALIGRTAYFSTSTFPGAEGQESVFAIPVDGSTPPTVIVAGGSHITVSGETLTYLVANPDGPAEEPQRLSYDLRTAEATPVPQSAHADEPGFCGAETTELWEAWCTGQTPRADAAEDLEPALLTIKETSGRTTRFAEFPVDPNNSPIPHDLVRLGRWTGISVTTETGQDREYLVDLETKEIKVFPDNTSFGALSPDRTSVLVSSYADKGPGPQRIVRIPSA